MNEFTQQLLITIAGIIGAGVGAGVSAHYGMKIILAKFEARLDGNDKQLGEHSQRLDRLEAPYFQKR